MSAPPAPRATSATDELRPPAGARSDVGAMLPEHCHDAVLPFAECVVRQVAHPLGAPRADAAQEGDRKQRVAERLAATIRLACGDDGHSPPPEAALDRAAALLAEDTVLLSACFQNTDLLPHAGSPAADAVALLVLRAMERLAAVPTDPAAPAATPGR